MESNTRARSGALSGPRWAAEPSSRSSSSSAGTPSPVFAEIRYTSPRSQPISCSQLFCVFVGLRGREIDLVEDRDDLEPRVDCQVEVRERLGLDPLCGVHQKQNAVAGGQRARHLVAEVDVAGRVDEIDLVGLAVCSTCSPSGRRQP